MALHKQVVSLFSSPQQNTHSLSLVVVCVLLQDPARVRLHEEMTRLTRRINVSRTEVDNLNKAAKAQGKKLSKLRKDLAGLQEARVRRGCVCGRGAAEGKWEGGG